MLVPELVSTGRSHSSSPSVTSHFYLITHVHPVSYFRQPIVEPECAPSGPDNHGSRRLRHLAWSHPEEPIILCLPQPLVFPPPDVGREGPTIEWEGTGGHKGVQTQRSTSYLINIIYSKDIIFSHKSCSIRTDLQVLNFTSNVNCGHESFSIFHVNRNLTAERFF